jgi:alkanesulfonate monooxygenase SsuD/methylene tetrahydromethanopterin reductase-like flavin-dependent oxidoreductase (luciferase family)
MKAEGKYYNFDIPEPYEIYPVPVQLPHPPIYMGAGTDRSMSHAARWGFGLMQSTLPDLATIADHINTYRSHMKEAVAPYNQNPAFGEVDVTRLVYVAPTDAQAKADSAEGVVRHVRSFVSGGTGRYFGEVTAERDDNALSYDNLVENTILHGSPDTVIRKIEEFRKVGATSIMLHYPPYYGPEKTTQMLRLFAREVLPHVQAMEAPRLAAD